MKIHSCLRCEGCGHVVGAFRWEVAWSRWVAIQEATHDNSTFEPRPCPDCAGTGALIEMDAGQHRPQLPGRRVLPKHDVAALLESRRRGYSH
jgi:hypothetical protein